VTNFEWLACNVLFALGRIINSLNFIDLNEYVKFDKRISDTLIDIAIRVEETR